MPTLRAKKVGGHGPSLTPPGAMPMCCICTDFPTMEGNAYRHSVTSLVYVCTTGSLMKHGLSQLSNSPPRVLREDMSMTTSQSSQVHQGDLTNLQYYLVLEAILHTFASHCIIPSCISITLPCSKCCSAELLLRAGLIHAVWTSYAQIPDMSIQHIEPHPKQKFCATSASNIAM